MLKKGKNQGRNGFFRLAQGRCDLGQKFWRQIFFSDFSRFFEQYNSKKNFFFQFTADIERTARTEQSDNSLAQFVVLRYRTKTGWILLGICIRNCSQVQDVVAQLWRNFAPPSGTNRPICTVISTIGDYLRPICIVLTLRELVLAPHLTKMHWQP